jgi:hypothetical protein
MLLTPSWCLTQVTTQFSRSAKSTINSTHMAASRTHMLIPPNSPRSPELVIQQGGGAEEHRLGLSPDKAAGSQGRQSRERKPEESEQGEGR